MSRIGKQPITIPSEVEVTLDESLISVKGPQGTLEMHIARRVTLEKKDNQIIVGVKDPTQSTDKANWGTTQRLITNLIKGVTEGFEKKLVIEGVGYRAKMQGTKLILELGFSHEIEYEPEEGIVLSLENENAITVTGIDKQKVGSVAAKIRSYRKPEPYKGKGIAYVGEHIPRKQGKQAGAGDEGGGGE